MPAAASTTRMVALLPSDADAGIWDYFATATIPDPDQMQRLLTGLEAYSDGTPATVPQLEAETGLRRGRVELMLKQLAVDGAVERVEQGWVRGAAAWTYDREHYDGIIATRRREADIMRDYTRGRRCLMQLLQESLDDASAAPCGRCSVCLGRLPETLRERPSDETVAAVTAAAARRDARARAAQDVAGRRLRSAWPDRAEPDGRAGPHRDLRRRARVARGGARDVRP